MFKLNKLFDNNIFKNNENININNIFENINNNIDDIYTNDINSYLSKYSYFKNINNINYDYKNKVSNIQIYKEEDNYLLLKCLYNNKNAIIKLFYNPFINFDLLYEQIVYLKLNNNDFIPDVYNIGYININTFFNSDIINYMNDFYDNNINNTEIKEIFKKSFLNLIKNNDDIDNYFLDYYKYNKKQSYLCNLLIFFKNKINKEIHIIITEDYTNYNNLLDYYNENIIISNNDNIDIHKDIFIIINKLFNIIKILNNKYNIIHNNLLLQNIYINNNFEIKIINYNMAYIKDINNLLLYKYYNYGIKNDLNYNIDYYTFINSLINDTKTTEILKPYNFFIYNKNNFKKINKILFKKN